MFPPSTPLPIPHHTVHRMYASPPWIRPRPTRPQGSDRFVLLRRSLWPRAQTPTMRADYEPCVGLLWDDAVPANNHRAHEYARVRTSTQVFDQRRARG